MKTFEQVIYEMVSDKLEEIYGEKRFVRCLYGRDFELIKSNIAPYSLDKKILSDEELASVLEHKPMDEDYYFIYNYPVFPASSVEEELLDIESIYVGECIKYVDEDVFKLHEGISFGETWINLKSNIPTDIYELYARKKHTKYEEYTDACACINDVLEESKDVIDSRACITCIKENDATHYYLDDAYNVTTRVKDINSNICSKFGVKEIVILNKANHKDAWVRNGDVLIVA